jgi:predicted O-methyltransferase YrrM
MTQERWTAVDGYINDLFVKSDLALEAALSDSTAAGLLPINVAPNQGKLLHLLAKVQRARTILEIGTLGGYSTIWLARALPVDGEVITLEADPKCIAIARANIKRAGLAEIVKVVAGQALETLRQLVTENRSPFDIIFFDADKENLPEYFPYFLKLSRLGTLIIVDNVVRGGAIADANSDDPKIQGLRRFNELVAAEPQMSATAIQTVGSKGYDGFTILLIGKD